MEREKLVIFGVGFLVKEVVQFINRYQLYDIVGFTVDRKYIKSDNFMGKPVYPVEELQDYVNAKEVKLFVAISWYNRLNKYKALKYEYLKERGYHFANLIAPSAVILTDNIGEGNWINEFSYIGFNAVLGNNNVISARASLAHYDQVGNHNFFGIACNVQGHVAIDDRCFFGGSSIVFNRVHIGNMCVVGAGSLIKKDLKDCSMTIASKARVIVMDEESVENVINYIP